MITIREKLETLPPPPSNGAVKLPGTNVWLVDKTDYDAIAARNALLCEALRKLLSVNSDHMTNCDKTMGSTHPCTCGAIEARAALAACEVKRD